VNADAQPVPKKNTTNPYVKLRELPESTQPTKLIPLRVTGAAKTYSNAPSAAERAAFGWDPASSLDRGPHLRRATQRLEKSRGDDEVDARKDWRSLPADVKPNAPAWESFLVSKRSDWCENRGRISPTEYIKLVGAPIAAA
jgi:hypothetical protein